jgi:hypothetical protein
LFWHTGDGLSPENLKDEDFVGGSPRSISSDDHLDHRDGDEELSRYPSEDFGGSVRNPAVRSTPTRTESVGLFLVHLLFYATLRSSHVDLLLGSLKDQSKSALWTLLHL